jgi:hypothetical protein
MVAPTLRFTAPTNNSTIGEFPSISGVASDGVAGSGIARVDLILVRRSDNKYWNGSTWGAAATLATQLTPGAAPEMTWTRNSGLPVSTDLLSGLYNVYAYVYDMAGNRSYAFITVTVKAPVAAAGVRGLLVTSPGTVGGTGGLALLATGRKFRSPAWQLAPTPRNWWSAR